MEFFVKSWNLLILSNFCLSVFQEDRVTLFDNPFRQKYLSLKIPYTSALFCVSKVWSVTLVSLRVIVRNCWYFFFLSVCCLGLELHACFDWTSIKMHVDVTANLKPYKQEFCLCVYKEVKKGLNFAWVLWNRKCAWISPIYHYRWKTIFLKITQLLHAICHNLDNLSTCLHFSKFMPNP